MYDKKEFVAFSREVEAALADMAEKRGIKIKAGNIRFSLHNFSITLDVSKKEVDGKPFEQVEFEKLCVLFGFEPSDYLRSFSMGGRTFQLVSFNPKGYTKPVIAQGDDGKRYKFGKEVQRLLN